MHSRVCITLTLAWILMSIPLADAARVAREELERQFRYGWSESATLIFYGTVAAVDFQDDPKLRSPYAEVLVRIDDLQRGAPDRSMVRVRIEDELQSYRWQGPQNRVGERGLWFLHRVREYEGSEPRGHLIRYMDRPEMERDPQFLAELMKYVVRDTVDQAIKPNILNLLTAERATGETASVRIALTYDDGGLLSDIQVLERSANVLFDSHVFDTTMQIHRRIRIPGSVRKTEIEISRKVL